MNRLIQVFKVGTHTDGAGTERTFTADDLRAIADKFNPEIGAVPIVKGHPETDDPAFGWISQFMFEETSGILYAVPTDVEPGFKADVKARRYARISIALYSPDSPANPVPGIYYPRHVGFLGAASPAVKGLKAANFNDKTKDFLMFNGDDDKQMNKFAELIATAFATSMKALGFKPSAEPADPADPAKIKVEETPEFIESEKARKLAEEALKAERKTNADSADETRRAGCAAFTEKLKKAGQITPLEAEQLTAVLFSLGAVTDELTFGEGDSEIKITAHKALSDLLSSMPVRIDFSEVSDEGGEGDLTSIGFNAPKDTLVSGDRMDLHRRITAYAQKNNVPYIEAVSIVERGA